MTDPIRIALIGAGLFARDAHIPALVALRDRFQIVAIASRTLDSARLRAAEVPYPVEATTDIPALLAWDDIEAVDVVLPVRVQPPVLEMALKSGKHIISEKPLATDLTESQRLMALHTSGSQWMVGENFRYQAGFVRAAELVAQGAIGRPVLANWTMYQALNPGDKYYETAWRRAGDFLGGFLLDGGVHWTAAFRLVVGEIAQVSGFTALSRDDMPPLNTMAANFLFEDGCIGNFSVVFGAPPDADYNTSLTISGSEGFLRADSSTVEIRRKGETRTIKTHGLTNVQAELAAFADAIRHGTSHRNTPRQALQDVAVIDALLRASESGQVVAVERFV